MRVKCIDASGMNFLTKGVIYRVTGYCGSMTEVTCDDGNIRSYATRRFTKIQEKQEKQMNKQPWNSYEFNIRSMDQIDTELIAKDLSPAQPVMLVEVEGRDSVLVVIHDSIYTKADNSGPYVKELSHVMGESYLPKKHMIKLHKLLQPTDPTHQWGEVPKDRVRKVLKVIRKIKDARWDNPCQAKVKVVRAKV